MSIFKMSKKDELAIKAETVRLKMIEDERQLMRYHVLMDYVGRMFKFSREDSNLYGMVAKNDKLIEALSEAGELITKMYK